MPEIPTIMESGIPDFEVTVWQGYAVPRGTPQKYVTAIFAKLGLPAGEADHRRVLSVLAYLRAGA